jgi:hypothetical protein
MAVDRGEDGFICKVTAAAAIHAVNLVNGI